MSSSSPPLRRITSIALTVAFAALATSGLLMLASLELQLRLHTVHTVFGVVMVAAGLLHLAFNRRALAAHLRTRLAMISGLSLAGVLVLMFLLALTSPVDRDAVRKIEEILSASRGQAHGKSKGSPSE